MSNANSLTVLSDDIYASRGGFEAVLVDRSINFEREAGFAIQQISGNEYTLSVAMNNRQSVVDSVTNIAAMGLSLSPAKKQAYLVPRKNKICLDISYMGLMDLAMATGSVKWAQAALVHEADTFVLNSLDKPPTHVFSPFAKAEARGPIVGVYVTIKTADGEYLTHTMTIEDAYAIRDRSDAWKSWKAGKAKSPGPWGSDEGEMIKKTCVKQAYKYWPKTERLETAIHHLNTEGGEGLAIIAEAAQTGLKIPAMQGIGDGIPQQTKTVLEAVASAIMNRFEANDLIGAYEEYLGVKDNPEYDDEKIWLWKQLPSNVRTAIRKHGDSLKDSESKVG
jgi:recombination protein RecT